MVGVRLDARVRLLIGLEPCGPGLGDWETETTVESETVPLGMDDVAGRLDCW